MAETVATPGSNADSGTPGKLPASKDRACPYCRTTFTSSSLGRHLDLYIKDKNPKPPDGIHDVEQIRNMRGSVTRRQARMSSSKREGSTPLSSKPTPQHERRSTSVGSRYMNGESSYTKSVTCRLNAPNWQVTGVINDIPSTPGESRQGYVQGRDVPSRVSTKIDISQNHKAMEERDRCRAVELALREVLDSVNAAKYEASPDGLYLKILTFFIDEKSMRLYLSTSTSLAKPSLHYACGASPHHPPSTLHSQ